MDVGIVTGSTSASATGSLRATGIDRQAFLQLLVAQLKNQDPMKPVDNQEFVAQLAQLHMLEQMEALSEAALVSAEMQAVDQSLSLLGQKVEYRADDGESTTVGTVEKVRITGGLPTLVVDGKEVAPGDVVAVVSG